MGMSHVFQALYQGPVQKVQIIKAVGPVLGSSPQLTVLLHGSKHNIFPTDRFAAEVAEQASLVGYSGLVGRWVVMKEEARVFRLALEV